MEKVKKVTDLLVDSFSRQITYLRISITDRCNQRCVYCMPAKGVPKRPHHEMLRYEEIYEIVKAAAQMGVKSVRLTGGEPLVRPQIVELVRLLRSIEELQDISMTTNGILLPQLASSLKEAGLNRVNISLDTLDPKKFTEITRIGDFEKTWQGILAAEEAGLKPVKINVVSMRGFNDNEFVDLALLTRDHPWHVRFIELMPFQSSIECGEGFLPQKEAYISSQEIRERLAHLELSPVNEKAGRGPARMFRIKDGIGQIGFISPVGDHFCASCNRLRITSDGNIRPCLLRDIEIPLLPSLRMGASITPVFQEALAKKPLGHKLAEDENPEERGMDEIGG